ncbi:hypothetical protein [Bacillus suaedae]|uniref:Uncharacterized protein n=1 Tax=Halalkalibacter suaedae TaxID=2822140 RepID=A0A940WYM2_9BACI|nr:hypothetical protein [Bacillus suaedae]MBP3953252.1 hypothetical protein [Bacillus suaedae]
MTKQLIGLTAIFFILGACSNENGVTTEEVVENFDEIVVNTEEAMNSASNEVEQNLLLEGDTAELESDAFVAYNTEAYSEMYDLFGADYTNDQFIEMMDEDKIEVLSEGTEVEVSDINLSQIEIMIPETDEIGYIHASMLSDAS